MLNQIMIMNKRDILLNLMNYTWLVFNRDLSKRNQLKHLFCIKTVVLLLDFVGPKALRLSCQFKFLPEIVEAKTALQEREHPE